MAIECERGDTQLMRDKPALQVVGLSILRALWCMCAHARGLGFMRVHYCTRFLEKWRACSRGPGTTARLETRLELFMKATERSTKGVGLRCDRGARLRQLF